MTDDERIIREALEAGPTPGPWVNYGRQEKAPGVPHSAVAAKTLLARVYSEAYGDEKQETANAQHIAACSPDRISRLLAEVERLREALTAANAEAEHFEREWYLSGDAVDRLSDELAESKQDAARYRWLRDKSLFDLRSALAVGDLTTLDAFIDAMRKEGGE